MIMNREYPIEEELEEAYKTINKLTNNWNELEEWINRNCFYDDDTLTYEELISKMEEIKENKK